MTIDDKFMLLSTVPLPSQKITLNRVMQLNLFINGKYLMQTCYTFQVFFTSDLESDGQPSIATVLLEKTTKEPS